jgi:hypothetical protein
VIRSRSDRTPGPRGAHHSSATGQSLGSPAKWTRAMDGLVHGKLH